MLGSRSEPGLSRDSSKTLCLEKGGIRVCAVHTRLSTPPLGRVQVVAVVVAVVAGIGVWLKSSRGAQKAKKKKKKLARYKVKR